jgi:hypothetical protein
MIIGMFRYDEMSQKFNVEYIAGGNSSFELSIDIWCSCVFAVFLIFS